MTGQNAHSPRQDVFASFPRGVAILELVNPNDVSTWRLSEINDSASTLVPPSIESFLSDKLLRLVPAVDLPALYRDVLFNQRPRMMVMLESPDEESNADPTRSNGNCRSYVLHAFPVGARNWSGNYRSPANFWERYCGGPNPRLSSSRT